MVRDVNLLSYLPPFMQEYLELQQIMQAERPDVQKLEDETEIIKDNQFIPSCDETGISRYEQLIGIVPNADDTLEARKSRVITRWNDSLPYTFRSLVERLNTMCGEDGYELITNFDEYELEINVSLPMSGQADELDYMLDYIIPANIVVISRNEMSHTMTGTAFMGGATVTAETYTIESKTNTEHSMNGRITDAASVTTYLQRTIN